MHTRNEITATDCEVPAIVDSLIVHWSEKPTRGDIENLKFIQAFHQL